MKSTVWRRVSDGFNENQWETNGELVLGKPMVSELIEGLPVKQLKCPNH